MTDTDTEPLAENELPILRAFGREERACDEDRRRDEYGKPEVAPVEQSPEEETRSVHHRVLPTHIIALRNYAVEARADDELE